MATDKEAVQTTCTDRELPSNSPVNTDARASSVVCMGGHVRAGYWER